MFYLNVSLNATKWENTSTTDEPELHQLKKKQKHIISLHFRMADVLTRFAAIHTPCFSLILHLSIKNWHFSIQVLRLKIVFTF